MKLFAPTVLFAAGQAADVQIENFLITKTRTSRLYVDWDLVGEDAAAVDNYEVIVYDENMRMYEKIRMSEPSASEREIHGLKPANKYFIQISAVASGARSFQGEGQTFEAYTSAKPIQIAYVADRDATGCTLQWEAVEGADQYRIVDTDSEEEWFTVSNSHWAAMEAGATHRFEISTVTCGSDCANPPNPAYGKPFELSATSIPPAPINLALSSIDVEDYDTVNARIHWDNPQSGSWDNIKIEYSPNQPPAKTQTPTYNSSGWSGNSLSIEGLYQNTIYTFTARFVSNGVEGPAETYSYAINDFSVNQPKGVAPKTQTCRVPTYLRAENLRVRRDPLGEFGPSMEVTWDHPATKQPENGYKLVFAPFKDIVDQKPWSVNVSGDQASYTVHGHEYDPYDEYTVSVIARHNEYDTQDASNPDFIASHFTGTVTKHQREGSFVAPDACCGSVRHNSKDGSSCCGGNLIYEGQNCCGDVAYSTSEFQCCSAGNLAPVYGEC